MESTAFFAKKSSDQEKQEERGMYTKSGKKLDTKYYCDNCKYYGHTRKECWHLIGYPHDKDKEPKKSKKEAAKKAKLEVENQSSTSQNLSLNNEEIQLIKDMISKGNIHFGFHTDVLKNNWIIDIGAS